MRLPSGCEVSKEKLIELCEGIIGEKLVAECTYREAYMSTAESLHNGEYADIPALDEEDIDFLCDVLQDVVIGCEASLRKALGAFMADSAIVNSW